MKTVAIVQARMGSTRLPGKVMMDLGGSTVLSRVLRRLERAKLVHETVVATTKNPSDDLIVGECERLGIPSFRGSEDDVLDRYYRAAGAYGADVVVRITSDCPLIDAELVDDIIRVLQNEKADYASNVFPRTYPRGLDGEAFTAGALGCAWREAKEPYQREHVTSYFYEHPEIFHLVSTAGELDYSLYRWTLDTEDDLRLIREIYAEFGNRDNFTWREAIGLMEEKPQLAELNAHVVQKALQH